MKKWNDLRLEDISKGVCHPIACECEVQKYRPEPLFFAQGRLDVQNAAKEIGRHVEHPKESNKARLKRLARESLDHVGLIWMFRSSTSGVLAIGGALEAE